MYTIEGYLKKDKSLCLSENITVNQSENNSATINIVIDEGFLDMDIYIELENSSGYKYISEKLEIDVDKKISFDLPSAVLNVSGEILVQLTLVGKTDKSYIIKTFKNDENTITVYPSINSADFILSTNNNSIVKLQENIDNCKKIIRDISSEKDSINSLMAEILYEKEQGNLKGDKGDKGEKGEPSSLDKHKAATTSINLSDIQESFIGSFNSPIIANKNISIIFNTVSIFENYTRSFVLYIKRTDNSAVVSWENNIIWAYDVTPVFPLNKVQKVHFETFVTVKQFSLVYAKQFSLLMGKKIRY